MFTATHLLLVTDVDGTLIDHHGVLPQPAAMLRARLDELGARNGAPVVLALASSRTLAELLVLQRILGVRGPCIAEDGAVLAYDAPAGFTADGPKPMSPAGIQYGRMGRRTLVIRTIGSSAFELRRELRRALIDAVPLERLDLHHAPPLQLARMGFRSRGAVRRALHARSASVLLDLASLPAHHRTDVVLAASTCGADVHCGGRWHTVTRNAGKGRALDALRTHVHSGATVVAIGNAENDASLLQAADLPFVIRNPGTGHDPSLSRIAGATPLDAVGPAGFLEMLDRITDADALLSTGGTR